MSPAEEDLRAKVRELFQDALDGLDADVTKLIAAGTGIVDEHEAADGPWRTPRKVAGAILQECAYRATWGERYVSQRALNKLRLFL